MRPHLFENEITVTLSTPGHPHAEIFYSTDGKEPTQNSIADRHSDWPASISHAHAALQTFG